MDKERVHFLSKISKNWESGLKGSNWTRRGSIFYLTPCTCGHLHSPPSLMAPGGQVITHFLESVFSNSSSGQLLRHFFPVESIFSLAPHEVTHEFSSLLMNSPLPHFVTHASPPVMTKKGSVHVCHPSSSSINVIHG